MPTRKPLTVMTNKKIDGRSAQARKTKVGYEAILFQGETRIGVYAFFPDKNDPKAPSFDDFVASLSE